MSDQIKDRKLLDQTVNAVNDSRKELEDKEFKKYWSTISVPLTFQDGLSKYTKSELEDIRKYLKVKNASGLKKADLIDVLAQQIPHFVEQLALSWDEERFMLLTTIVENGGHMTAPRLSTSQLDYFRRNGLIYTGTNEGEQIVAIPAELAETIQALQTEPKVQEAIKRNTELVKLTKGLLYYYGALTTEQLVKQIGKYASYTPSYTECMSLIADLNMYLDEVRIEEDTLFNSRVMDSEKVLQAHKAKVDVPFYPFDRQQLVLAAESKFIDRNKHYHDLVNYLMTTFDVTKEEADAVASETVFAIRNDQGLNDVMTILSYMFELTDMNIVRPLTDIVLDLMNNTRKWTLKGYTSKELKQIASTNNKRSVTRTVVKVGRNEPCPCGSGKKYKKCCGKSA
ncbi:SEC-C metal-binding domain-containing protein [Gracilibacillus sp. S3-1-1]|uniref:SEC-C metal-binding domain-containing protein n=1 Tax=Gracilibacillus pellucidus TaxID=3095368 RepID=A0ACC6M0I9_9BACI|nr:SEC-C metal-binding domain-containing protein [Gracilibacillus sp. S3-1-1]MDX8044416.1 SEC-C metal-binding domain-containing protein [Gracilibacillus sp. S3-1-1]